MRVIVILVSGLNLTLALILGLNLGGAFGSPPVRQWLITLSEETLACAATVLELGGLDTGIIHCSWVGGSDPVGELPPTEPSYRVIIPNLR